MLATVKAHYDGSRIVLNEAVYANWVAGQDLSITYHMDEERDWRMKVERRKAFLAELAASDAPFSVSEGETEAFIANLREERDV